VKVKAGWRDETTETREGKRDVVHLQKYYSGLIFRIEAVNGGTEPEVEIPRVVRDVERRNQRKVAMNRVGCGRKCGLDLALDPLPTAGPQRDLHGGTVEDVG